MKKFIIICILAVAMLFLVSCAKKPAASKPNGKTPQTSTQTSATVEPTAASTLTIDGTSSNGGNSGSSNSGSSSNSNAVVTSITHAEMAKLIKQAATFNELKKQYGLAMNPKLENQNSFETVTSPSGFTFTFGNSFNNTIYDYSQFKLQAISGPASLVFPKYIGMQTAQIPGYDQQGSMDQLIQINDQYGAYYILLSEPGILGANDQVTMGAM
ncbi:MAG: hypothetical protein FWC54_01825 [Actinomycetia bacterium]|nr:hypothetical protein [Actinomycetes bacterium]